MLEVLSVTAFSKLPPTKCVPAVNSTQTRYLRANAIGLRMKKRNEEKRKPKRGKAIPHNAHKTLIVL
ncbi:MAG TPA: hypothetical protein VJL29_04865 [Thermoguttaceae bacterium]|nr:hypothetical protein [Thermoguttaceae bacterium]